MYVPSAGRSDGSGRTLLLQTLLVALVAALLAGLYQRLGRMNITTAIRQE